MKVADFIMINFFNFLMGGWAATLNLIGNFYL